jgi:NADH-quinone oxidoreductase subunit A
MPSVYIPILIFAILAAIIPSIAFALARRASRNTPSDDAQEDRESGAVALEETERRRNSSQIYLVGVLFVVCDVSIIFLIPWAVQINELGAYGLVAIAGFLGVLGCGYVWLYKRRALERL